MAEEVQQTSAQVEKAVVVTAGVNKRLAEISEVEDPNLWHHLIFCEELENDDQNDGVVCWLCQQPILGAPAYKCSKCNFHQHKLCIDRPHGVDIGIEHKYLWKTHHLIFVQEPDINGGKKEVVCSVCKEPTFGPTYECSISECTFILHKSCGELPNVIRHALHPEHILILQEPSSTGNVCFFCRKNCNGSFFYRCCLCSFNLHIICASRWRIKGPECHQHSLHPSRKQMQFTCECCGEKTKDTAYLCSECGVLIHGKCALFPHTIKTKTHDHFLFRIYSLRPTDGYLSIFYSTCQDKEPHIVDMFCCLCYKRVNKEYGAYYCLECSYVDHLDCAKEFQSYSTTSTNPVASVFKDCLTHLVEGIHLVEDKNAGRREITHFSHPQHNLILSNDKPLDVMRCEPCMQFIIFGTPFYGCTKCNFFLHIRCAKLPSTIRRTVLHEHSLTLFSRASSMDGLFWCAGCRRSRHGFTYRCDECSWYNLDVQCCLIPEILKHEGHQHALFLAIRSFETCIACGKDGGKFVCTYCDKFALCFRCATLPLVAKYEHDTHLLKLSYTREDESGEYYCLICEKEIDQPDYWFYYYVKCKFTAHPRCIIGENPCIKFGRTYVDEDHLHPLTIVQKTEHSPSCDSCNEPLDSVAIKCAQYKFIVHPYFYNQYLTNCLQNVNDRMK